MIEGYSKNDEGSIMYTFRRSRRVSSDRGPSVRVLRSETRLTVYRSTKVRMLCQLVASFLVERLSVKFHKKGMLSRLSTREVGWE